jgi:2-polyprenyl-3-methyl-5-hydroxy-6-metoxy-1,4-benzoquinol methylase
MKADQENSTPRGSGAVVESGIVAGNTYDKYGTGNPVARYLMRRFLDSVNTLIESVKPDNIHEVGCGEGHLSRILCQYRVPIQASDFSSRIIDIARTQEQIDDCQINWKVASIYELTPEKDAAHLVVCCEVLEHLPDPDAALEILHRLASPYLLVSVPREPLWRCLNVLRGKYIAQGGNTPGHINHWGKHSFTGLISRYFEVLTVRSPLPWTMIMCRRR